MEAGKDVEEVGEEEDAAAGEDADAAAGEEAGAGWAGLTDEARARLARVLADVLSKAGLCAGLAATPKDGQSMMPFLAAVRSAALGVSCETFPQATSLLQSAVRAASTMVALLPSSSEDGLAVEARGELD